VLIKDVLKKTRGLSGRKAAEMAGMSEGRWRQIVNGYQVVSAGQYSPVVAPPDTLARMAHVVGVTPEQLEEVEREDAANELRWISRTMPPERGPVASPAVPSAAGDDDADDVFADLAEREMWGNRHMSPAERADHIAQMRVRRVTTELRAELAEVRAEVEELRRQLQRPTG
jgi:transcriptional regulator with XRE-family HTH domain